MFRPDEPVEPNRDAHPLDKLSLNEIYKIYGEDTNELEKSLEADLAESEGSYFRESLT